MLDEPVEGTTNRHQAGEFLGVDISNAARQSSMLDIVPLRDALLLEPRIERIDIREAGHRLP